MDKDKDKEKEKEKEKEQEKPKQVSKPKPRPVVKSKVKTAAKEKDSAADSTGRLTPVSNAPVTKAKKTTAVNAAVASAAKRGVSAVAGPSRSRSTSEMPAPLEPISRPKVQVEEPEPSDEEAAEDDKLYCICKTSYDEDKVMIACDRCDEWYHTQCLNMNDLEVDLIDQFVCPPCVKANPNLPLKTTYKQRCMAGLKHPNPSSPNACHKPSRGAFSKFCSEECGITYMQRRIDSWGGDQTVLWASVRDAKPREGVVVKVQVIGSQNGVAMEEKRPGVAFGNLIQEDHEIQRPSKTQRERTITRLQTQLEKIAPKREALKRELDIILWRQKLLRLAAARAERVEECGWDHRLCFDDEECIDFGDGVLESYAATLGQPNGNSEDVMHVDGTPEDSDWWCRGKKKCHRHAGWQKLRGSEFEFDQELKEKAIEQLTTREREIRKQLEDAISLPTPKPTMPGPLLPPKNGHAPSNGVKAKPNGTSGKKGKQKH
ncbi:hypothetical protein C8Q80DRAFT_1091269 [Daedaleopsis nitida]|nr:hypothetical protein C8Q80DRAFT_1091269 [Daedaleopsis nitida]